MLRGDCERCVGLCCVAPAFAASADFAMDKPAGVACTNLQPDFRCGIHHRLRADGFGGCTAYDCFGAGQQVSQVTFAGQDWRESPELAATMFDVFGVMRDLHEILFFVSQALQMPAAQPLRSELTAVAADVEELTRCDASRLLNLDRMAVRKQAGTLLTRVSEAQRGGTPKAKNLAGKDLIGRDLRARDLRGALLTGALLIGANLQGADLAGADVRGADLRGAAVAGADLRHCLFLIQTQVEGARGDGATRLPKSLSRPAHWAVT
jgi:uncharacterized protein YjbI with pentapeptide repeats